MRVLASLALLAAAAACGSAEPEALRVACRAPATQAAFNRDSTVALCVFPGYRLTASTGRLWARGTPTDSAYAWLSVAVLDSNDAASEWGTPPRPRSFRESAPPGAVHALAAESIVVHRDAIDGRVVEVETARVTGGVAGWRLQPVLRAAWRLGDGRWALAQGQAAAPATLDSLRAMLRSARVAAARPPRPAT